MRNDIASVGKSNPADFARVGGRHGSFSGCGTVFPLENKRSKKKQRESQCGSSDDPLSSHDLVHHHLSARLAQSRNFPLALPPTKSIHASWRGRDVLLVISQGDEARVAGGTAAQEKGTKTLPSVVALRGALWFGEQKSCSSRFECSCPVRIDRDVDSSGLAAPQNDHALRARLIKRPCRRCTA